MSTVDCASNKTVFGFSLNVGILIKGTHLRIIVELVRRLFIHMYIVEHAPNFNPLNIILYCLLIQSLSNSLPYSSGLCEGSL